MDILIPNMIILREKKMLGPFYGKPNLTRLTRSSASSWIFDLECKKIFLNFPDPPQTKIPAHF
jgi:hypothetical protein